VPTSCGKRTLAGWVVDDPMSLARIGAVQEQSEGILWSVLHVTVLKKSLTLTVTMWGTFTCKCVLCRACSLMCLSSGYPHSVL
jgi:hypothetical protein